VLVVVAVVCIALIIASVRCAFMTPAKTRQHKVNESSFTPQQEIEPGFNVLRVLSVLSVLSV
jgi:hypothetical protein